MAKLGFYNIKTIECLNREFKATEWRPKSLPDYNKKRQAADSLEAETNGDKNKKPEQNIASKKREQKEEGKLAMAPETEIRGHTGYLTFAVKF